LEPTVIRVEIELAGFGKTTGAYVSPAEYTFPLSGLPAGEHAIHVSARDEAGNQRETTVHFVVDPEAMDLDPRDILGDDGPCLCRAQNETWSLAAWMPLLRRRRRARA
jgi:hypothetical protein